MIHIDAEASLQGSTKNDTMVNVFVPNSKTQTYWNMSGGSIVLSTIMNVDSTRTDTISRTEYVVPIQEIDGYYSIGIGITFWSMSWFKVYKVWLT